ncbi:MAG: CvpA family protein [Leeuwenhoekiella sp.]
MNYLDIIIGIFLLVGLLKGLKNGFLIEVASLIGLIAGIYGAIHFSYYAVDFLYQRVSWSDNTINLVAFAVTFIIIVIVISLLAKLLTQVANFAMLGIINKIFGAVFGVLKAAFIISVIIMFINALTNHASIIDENIKAESILYPIVQPVAPIFLPNILKGVEDYKEENTQNESA